MNITDSRMDSLDEQAMILRERQAFIWPLFHYCRMHGILVGRAASRASMWAVGVPMHRQKVWRIRVGYTPAPQWFIAGICREIGQPIEVVMGAEWAQRHLSAPTPELPATTQQDDRQGDRQGDRQDDAQVGQRRAS
jgi:hypothetical protein